MPIDPVNANTAGSSRAGAPQVGAQQAAPDVVRAPAVRQTATDGLHGDTIQLSSTSLTLNAQAGAVVSAPPVGTMSPVRMQGVLGRLASGFYDQPSTRDAVARGVAADLTNNEDAR